VLEVLKRELIQVFTSYYGVNGVVKITHAMHTIFIH